MIQNDMGSANSVPNAPTRGGPLIMLGVLLSVWIIGRAVLWESPFSALSLPSADMFLAEGAGRPGQTVQASEEASAANNTGNAAEELVRVGDAVPRAIGGAMMRSFPSIPQGRTGFVYGESPVVAAGHNFLMATAFRVDWPQDTAMGPTAGSTAGSDRQFASATQVSPAGPAIPMPIRGLDRWSLDAFAFYRQGSGSTSISQGRVPVYGASQVGANLQYRINPGSRRDPRAFVRAYRAFVPDGENEVAAGLSARPVPALPVRVAAEVRVTDNSFGTQVRPAAYAITELPVVQLPFDLRAEAYGGAGYVGGSADTAFVDGQASISREVVRINGQGSRSIRFSVGGGAWGGAQRDASRLDVGPSARVDLTIGDVPARISVDWRERVAGDAAPNSGIAATLSTRF